MECETKSSCYKSYHKRYYEKNKEKVVAKSLERYYSNKEAINARNLARYYAKKAAKESPASSQPAEIVPA